MNVRRFLYLSAWLILLALLLALYATWMSGTGNCIDKAHLISFVIKFGGLSSLTLLALIIPIGLCLMHDNRPQWFARWRILGWIAGIMAFSWIYMNAKVFVPYWLGIDSIREPEARGAFVLGWLYLPMVMLPVLTIRSVVHVLRRKDSRRGTPTNSITRPIH